MPPLVLRTYDIGDLLIEREDHLLKVEPPGVDLLTSPYRADYSGAGGLSNLFGEGERPPPIFVGYQEVIDVIERTVSSQADPRVAVWRDEGGPAVIEYIDQMLIVTQNDHGHRKIEELLALLRKQRLGGPLVTIDARWVLVDDGAAAALTADPAAPQPQEVSAAALEKAGAKVAYRGRITCFDRQKVHFQSGRISTYLQDAEPVVAAQALGADPTVGVVFVGAALQVRPVLAPDAASAVLDLYSSVSELKGLRERSLPDFGQVEGKGGSAKLSLEMPDVIVNTFRASVRVPVGKPVLIGGITAHAPGKGKVVYLVLEVKATK